MIVDFLQQFNQPNTGDNQGTVWASKNIRLDNKGKVSLSPVMGYKTDTTAQSNLGTAMWGVTFVSIMTGTAGTVDQYYAVADDRVWESANSNPNSAWTEVSSTPTDIDSDSDIIAWNGKVYVLAGGFLRSYTKSVGFSTVDNLNFGAGTLAIYANRLYYTDRDDEILSINTSETPSTLGSSNALELQTTLGSNLVITKIASVSDGLWIATLFSDKEGGEMIKWDGETANVVDSRYSLPNGVLSMEIMNNRPYIVDAKGIVRVFDGTDFSPIAQFPILYDEKLQGFNADSNDRWIHPRGMVRVDDEIYFLVNNIMQDSTQNPIENMPAGVWAWNKNHGLYHKYSMVNVDLTSVTLKDFGAGELAQVGALVRSEATGGISITRANQSEVFAGVKLYTDATSTKGAIAITNEEDDIKKAGYFVTAQLNAEQFDEVWKEVIAVHDRFKNSTDRIVIKYRTYESDPIYGTATWAEDTRLTTNIDLSNVDEGDEIEILRGVGSGLCLTVKNKSGTQVRFKENFLSSMTGTCRIRAQKWQEAALQDNTDEHFLRKTLDASSGAWVQFKVFMVGTGKSPQLIKLLSVSGKDQNAK